MCMPVVSLEPVELEPTVMWKAVVKEGTRKYNNPFYSSQSLTTGGLLSCLAGGRVMKAEPGIVTIGKIKEIKETQRGQHVFESSTGARSYRPYCMAVPVIVWGKAYKFVYATTYALAHGYATEFLTAAPESVGLVK